MCKRTSVLQFSWNSTMLCIAVTLHGTFLHLVTSLQVALANASTHLQTKLFTYGLCMVSSLSRIKVCRYFARTQIDSVCLTCGSSCNHSVYAANWLNQQTMRKLYTNGSVCKCVPRFTCRSYTMVLHYGLLLHVCTHLTLHVRVTWNSHKFYSM